MRASTLEIFLDTENITKSAIDSYEFWITPNRVKQETGKHNFEEAKIQINHSWHVDLMEDWLKDYPEKDIMKYIWWETAQCEGTAQYKIFWQTRKELERMQEQWEHIC